MNYISKYRNVIQIIFGFIVLSGVLYGQYLIIGNGQVINLISQIGYLGVFLFSFINGFNVIVPIVPTSLMPALLEAGYQFWILLAVMSVGMSCADMIGYLVGRYLRNFQSGDRYGVLSYLQSIKETSYYAPLACMLVWGFFVPLPNEIIMVPLGIMGYRLSLVFAISISANIVFNIITAFGFMQIFSFIA